jgi:voltage-gated sodium channel
MRELRKLRESRQNREDELIKRHMQNRSDVWRARHTRVLETGVLSPAQRWVDRLVSSWMFDAFIGAVICFNAVTIGIESAYTAKGLSPPDWVSFVEYAFLGVYTVELSMRVHINGLGAFSCHWVKFDGFLVFCGMADIIVRIALAGDSNEVLANTMLVRMLRLTRLARAARLLVQFRVLWLLVQGLINSFLTIMWTFVIIFVLIYIFAVLGLEVMRPDESAGEAYQEATMHFNEGIGHSMLVLVQFLTLDSIGSIYTPICVAKPYLTVYFASYILLVSVALMNLVTALMVDSALSQSHQDREAEKAWEAASRKKALPKLKAMFAELDEDGSGCLELGEIANAPDELKEQLQQIAKMEDCEELFHMLDYDSSGSIGVDEFCDGVLKASQDNKPLELLRLVRQCAAIQENTKVALQTLDSMRGRSDSGSALTASAQERKDGVGKSRGTDEAGADASKPHGPVGAPTLSRQSTAAELKLGSRVSTVESRLSGIEAQLSGMDALLHTIADAVARPQVCAALSADSRVSLPSTCTEVLGVVRLARAGE